MSAAENYKVWVGCLACYNNGLLRGAWFLGSEAPQTMAEFGEAFDEPPDCDERGHDELWVMDHEGSPVRSEYSPMSALKYAEDLELVEGDELEPFLEWLRYHGEQFDVDRLEEFQDSQIGEDLLDWIAGIYDTDDIPSWIEPHMGRVYESMAHDMQLGGEVFELNSGWYRST